MTRKNRKLRKLRELYPGGVDNYEDQVRSIHRLADFRHHLSSQRIVGPVHTRSVNQYNLRSGITLPFQKIHDAHDAVTRRLRLGADNRQLLSRKRIQQRGLAGVGTSEDAHKSRMKGHVSNFRKDYINFIC